MRAHRTRAAADMQSAMHPLKWHLMLNLDPQCLLLLLLLLLGVAWEGCVP
jgi:hypothetical protein